MWDWLANNPVELIGITIGAFIAYHVFYLSRSLNFKDRLVHKDSVRQRVELILRKYTSTSPRRVDLMNVKKYLTHYPNSNEENRHGYTCLRAELKTLRFNGVEFFCGVRELYKKSDGTLTLRSGPDRTREPYNALEVGLIPYGWIEYVDEEGDEYGGYPLFFTQFNGKSRVPYESYSYYKTSDNYRAGSDPADFQWSRIDVEVELIFSYRLE